MSALYLNAGCNDNNDNNNADNTHNNNHVGNTSPDNGGNTSHNDNDNENNNNDDISEGVPFEAPMLGLVPGSTTAELNFTWYSDSTEKSAVRIFNESGKLVKTWEGNSGAASGEKCWNKVTAKELQADTPYQYSVSNDGVNWSYRYAYRTPKTHMFRFASVGDSQLTTGAQDSASAYFSVDRTTAEGWKETVAKIANKGVDFIASVGDQVDKTSGGDEREYAHFFAPPQLRHLPFSPTVGNHDRHYPFIYHYHLPNEQTFEPIVNATNNNSLEYGTAEAAGNYWYLYNNTLFVVLNTSAYPDSPTTAEPYIARFEQTLSAATHANQGKYAWLVVQQHKSTASVAQHVADRDIGYYVEAGLEALMDKHHVDVVLSGHDHVYVRSYIMKNGARVETAQNAQGSQISGGQGTLYLTLTTASGLKYYDVFHMGLYEKNNASYPPLADGTCGSVEYMRGAEGGSLATDKLPLSTFFYKQNKKPSYAIFEVNGNTMSVVVYETDNDEAHIDSFVVSK